MIVARSSRSRRPRSVFCASIRQYADGALLWRLPRLYRQASARIMRGPEHTHANRLRPQRPTAPIFRITSIGEVAEWSTKSPGAILDSGSWPEARGAKGESQGRDKQMRRTGRHARATFTIGEVAEWSNAPDSKSGVRFYRTVGSNPTLSARNEKTAPSGAVFISVRESGVDGTTGFDKIAGSDFGQR